MKFPDEGSQIGGFFVESSSVEHVHVKRSNPRRYEYPVKLIVHGEGDEQDVRNAFKQLLSQQHMKTTSGYGNPYTCGIGEMHITSIDDGRFLIEALGYCTRTPIKANGKDLESEQKTLEITALKVYDALFQRNESSVKIERIEYPVMKTSASKIRHVKVGSYTFIEQNPQKASRWGTMAQKGHRILWVCRGPAYLYQVVDGQFRSLRKKKE
ncbi:MAG: hypothetical protein JSV35_02675 [Candidatus Bathyarchaeota archaeon]|nr:MAG: hypothetical protein JSV35_02675 [Candidatus Bathyarchaeota archaeon]